MFKNIEIFKNNNNNGVPLLSSRGTFGPSGDMGQGPIAPGRESLGLV